MGFFDASVKKKFGKRKNEDEKVARSASFRPAMKGTAKMSAEDIRKLLEKKIQEGLREVDGGAGYQFFIDKSTAVVTLRSGDGIIFGGARNNDAVASLKNELKNATAQVKAFQEQMEQITKKASPYATVLMVLKEKKKVVISTAGRSVEVELPADGSKVAPGDTVKLVGETMQILEVVPMPDTGEVAPVTRIVSDSIIEIERNGGTRAIAYDNAEKLEEGDRVVIDQTGSVVVSNLGKPRNRLAFGDKTGVTWDDVGGLHQAKRELREAIEAPVKHADLFKKFGKRPISGVLLYGPPGCGKTMLGKAAATAQAEVHGAKGVGAFYYVKGPELLNMYVGQTEENIRRIFADARRHKKEHGFPAIVFLDEVDAILGKRGEKSLGLTQTIVPQFLAEMDGLEDSGAFIVLATNRPDTLDPAIVRDGRIDRRIKISRPTRDDTESIFAMRLANGHLRKGTSYADLAKIGADAVFDPRRVLFKIARKSKGLITEKLTLGHVINGATVAGIVDRATSYAMRRIIDRNGYVGVDAEDIHAAVDSVVAESAAVNHDDEINEFCEGWRPDVTSIERVSHASA